MNHRIHNEEVNAGLWETKATKEYKQSKKKADTANEPESQYKLEM